MRTAVRPGPAAAASTDPPPVVSEAPRGRPTQTEAIQRQLGHVNLGTTSICLQGIDTEEIIAAVNSRQRR